MIRLRYTIGVAMLGTLLVAPVAAAYAAQPGQRGPVVHTDPGAGDGLGLLATPDDGSGYGAGSGGYGSGGDGSGSGGFGARFRGHRRRARGGGGGARAGGGARL